VTIEEAGKDIGTGETTGMDESTGSTRGS